MSDDLSVGARAATKPRPPPPPPAATTSMTSDASVGAGASPSTDDAARAPRMDGAEIQAQASAQEDRGQRFDAFTNTQRGPGPIPEPGGSQAAREGSEMQARRGGGPQRTQRALGPAPAGRRTTEQLAEDMARHSPTARAALQRFRAAGGRFQDIPQGGTYTPGRPPVIGVGQNVGGRPATDEERMQTIAHELGHSDYTMTPHGRYAPPGAYPRATSDRQSEARREASYIRENSRRALANEGHATVVNARIREELLRATGKDIGIAGMDPATYQGLTQGARSDQERAERIGEHYRRHLQPSNAPFGVRTYGDYYPQGYREHYRRQYTPGGPGN